ncbi:MAG: glycosyltransferase [Lachnospiraceae bacterium]|nr:glycosyltransferase [Lachnospiraceae bacterium]
MRQLIVDVIIPTYKPDKKFELLINRLLKQSYPIHRIHVINTETNIFPEELCWHNEKMDVTHISPDAFDHGATRDMGAASSNADIMIFMTQDAVPANGKLVEELLRPFEDEQVAITYGRQLPEKDCKIIERYTRSFNYPQISKVKSEEDIKKLGIKTFFCSNVCAAYKKSIYDEMGGFVKHTIFNEDMIFAGQTIKAGYKIAYVAEAEVIHSHNYGNIQQFKRNFDLAVSQKDHPEVFEGIKSEDEGIKLVKQTIKYLLKIKKPWLIFSLVVKSGFKYMGFKLGKNYKRLPNWLLIKCTMNPRYWSV